MRKITLFCMLISISIISQNPYFIPVNSNIPVSATSINSKTLLNNAKYDAKLIEMELLQLSGQILDVAF